MNAQIRQHWFFYWVALLLVVIAATMLSGCGSAAEEVFEPGGEVVVETPEPALVEQALSPAAVTDAFFAGYVAGLEGNFRGEREGTAADLIRESGVLSPALLAKLDRDSGQGFDPVLRAQDLPQEISVEVWEEGETAAMVIVHEAWSGGSAVDLTVDLVRDGAGWLLDDIREGSPATPDGTAMLFYSWYLDRIGQGRNPLVDGSYRESDLLSAGFIDEVDAALAAMEGGGYDPILLAQDVPVGFDVVSTVEEGDTAEVTIVRYFGGNPEAYPLVVHLQRDGRGWLIADVADPAAGQAANLVAAAEGFYRWYLDYIGDPASDTFRNPLVDRAYREAPFVSEVFVVAIDTLLDEEIEAYGGIMGDPILQAQAIPTGFEVVTGRAEDLVTVNLFFGETVRPVEVRGIETDGVWLLHSIIPAGSTLPAGLVEPDEPAVDTTGWQTVSDEELGFSFLLPPDWVAQPMVLTGSEIPDDWPVAAGYTLMPQTVADAIAAHTGPPDPNAPMHTLFLLEAVVGDQTAFDRVYPAALSETIIAYGEYAVRVERDHEEYTVVRYVFQHPRHPELSVVFSDALSEFPGREGLAAEVKGILPAILGSFRFME